MLALATNAMLFTPARVFNHRGLTEHPNHDVSVFYFGTGEQRARPDEGWFEAVDYINSKNNFMALAEELDVPVPKTLCLASVAEIGDERIAEIELPCYLKAAISVSGVGLYRCADESELRDALTRFEPDVRV